MSKELKKRDDKKDKYKDTIAAISTPAGEGGIGIVRMSGPLSLSIMKKLFVPFSKGRKSNIKERLAEDFIPKPRYAYFGTFSDSNGEIIDDVICIYFKEPSSYTREDMVEIQAHGSPVSLRKILNSLVSEGARIAEAGEFTKLAFMNGRIDLSQAEAVMDLISAKADAPHGIAIKQLSGLLKIEIEEIREKLRDILARITVNIDFPDEDIEQEEYRDLIDELKIIKLKVDKIASSANSGKIAKDGIKTSIIGRPNVGKSSLMNLILGEDRAIVTNIPGTTRDFIEEQVNYKGIPIVLTDTAGIRNPADEVEKIGIDRAKNYIESSDVLILLVDGSEELMEEDYKIIDMVKKAEELSQQDLHIIVSINKIDIGKTIKKEKIKQLLPKAIVLESSLIEYDGAENILDEIEKMVSAGTVTSEMGNIITNERHKMALIHSSLELSNAINALKAKEPLEMVEITTHMAYDFLGEIIGETAGEEILDAVFEKFCLGK